MNKGMIRRALSVFIVCAAASQAQAAVPTSWATPTGYDVVTAVTPGIMVHGAFGNVGCPALNVFFIPKAGNEQQYAQMVATVMMAVATGKRIMAYVAHCAPQNWYADPAHTFGNVVGTSLHITE